MDIEVRPCASREELRDVLNVIGHYFGHENAPEDVERFTQWIEVERIHAAFEGARASSAARAPSISACRCWAARRSPPQGCRPSPCSLRTAVAACSGR